MKWKPRFCVGSFYGNNHMKGICLHHILTYAAILFSKAHYSVLPKFYWLWILCTYSCIPAYLFYSCFLPMICLSEPHNLWNGLQSVCCTKLNLFLYFETTVSSSPLCFGVPINLPTMYCIGTCFTKSILFVTYHTDWNCSRCKEEKHPEKE